MPELNLSRRALTAVRIDFAPRHRQPTAVRVSAATLVAVVGSLVADALLVLAGKALFPSTKVYQHYQFGDYATLTILGVLAACLSWPILTRVSSAPRWLYARLAVVVTLVLLLPDVALLAQGQPGKAVIVLMVMHVAIAVVTYAAVVGIAAVGVGARISRRRGSVLGLRG